MNFLFCNNPLDKQNVDPDFEVEFLSAVGCGFAVHLFSYEDLTIEENAIASLKRLKSNITIQDIIYRGWMLKPKHYNLLYNALLSKGYKLINTAVEYQNCHYLPDSYKYIENETPKTIWFNFGNSSPDYNKIFSSVSVFGSSPVIVKDFVKSQKHYWDTACFIPTVSDIENVKKVIDNFLQLQGADLNEGLVIREFVELNELARHSKSGMPLKQEYRLFFYKKKFLACYNYWEEGSYETDEQLPIDHFSSIAHKVESNFFTMDVAKRTDGRWIIIELGDGQVSGLSSITDIDGFYKKLKHTIF
ncbi:MAG: ATP-grasp domain-containing protein [Chitinophagaceae bacterium]